MSKREAFSHSRLICTISFMDRTIKIIIGLLCVAALGLGYVIYTRMSPAPEAVSLQSTSSSPTSNPLPTATPSSGKSLTPIPSFNADEALILKPPPLAGSKAEDIGRYYATIDKIAKNSDTMELGSQCYANPLVVSIKYGSKLKVTNNDIYDHALNFDGSIIYTIPSKETQTITVNFSRKAGIYVYSCDINSPSGKIVGVLKVMP